MYERFTKHFRVEIRTPSSCQCYPARTQPVFEIHLPLFGSHSRTENNHSLARLVPNQILLEQAKKPL
ncbi:hypothetical protein ACNIUS_24390, partial [Escherichia coli]